MWGGDRQWATPTNVSACSPPLRLRTPESMSVCLSLPLPPPTTPLICSRQLPDGSVVAAGGAQQSQQGGSTVKVQCSSCPGAPVEHVYLIEWGGSSMLDWECDGVCMHVCVCVCVCACECVCVCTHVQASGRVSSRPCGGAKSIGTEANENLPGKHLPLI